MKNINPLYFLFGSLTDDSTPHRMALGLAFGLTLAWTPVATLQWFVLLLVLFILKMNLILCFFSIILGSLGYTSLDPMFHNVGSALILSPTLSAFWQSLYNAPLLAFCDFTNTQTLGRFVSTAVGAPIVYLLLYLPLQKYERTLSQWIWNSWLFRSLMRTRFYRNYSNYQTHA